MTNIEKNKFHRRKSDQRFRIFMKHTTEAIWCIELDPPIYTGLPEDEQIDLFYKRAIITEANDSWARITGYESGNEMLGFRLDVFMPRSIPENISVLKKIIRSNYSLVDFETVEKFQNGEKRILFNNLTGVIEGGHLVNVWGISHDITEKRVAEEKLKQAEQRYRTVADYTYDWEYWVAPNGSLNYVSPSCERITGYTVDQFKENPLLLREIILPEDKGLWDDHSHKRNTDPDMHEISFRIRRLDGGIRWIEHGCQSVYDPSGEFFGIRGSNRDITARKRIEDDLKKKDSLLVEAQSIAQMGSWEWNIITNELIWSDEIYRIFGVSPEEYTPDYEFFLKRVHPDDLETVKDAVNFALSNPSSNYNIVHRIIRPDGSERIVRERGKVMCDGAGKASHMIGTVQDVTDIKAMNEERQKLRAELSRMERIGMMGVITAGIAHEVNQPLAAILSNAQAALRYLAGDRPDLDEVKEAAQDIVSDAKRAGKIVHSIRNIMGKSELKNENIDFNEIVREILTLIKREALNRQVLLSEDLQPDLPSVFGDPIQIQQVLLNLLKNALDAMKGHGTPNPKILVSTRFKKNGGVLLSVSDSGPGVNPHQLTAIFDSFQSTKKGGLGIGLSMSRSIAENHGGSIWAENRPDGGTTFFLKLPVGEN